MLMSVSFTKSVFHNFFLYIQPPTKLLQKKLYTFNDIVYSPSNFVVYLKLRFQFLRDFNNITLLVFPFTRLEIIRMPLTTYTASIHRPHYFTPQAIDSAILYSKARIQFADNLRAIYYLKKKFTIIVTMFCFIFFHSSGYHTNTSNTQISVPIYLIATQPLIFKYHTKMKCQLTNDFT